MDIKTTLTPSWMSDAAPYEKTDLKLTIDVSSIEKQLLQYDLYIVALLEIPDSTSNAGTLQYEYTRIFRKITTGTIDFEVSVLGTIVDPNKISASAKGYYICAQSEVIINEDHDLSL